MEADSDPEVVPAGHGVFMEEAEDVAQREEVKGLTS